MEQLDPNKMRKFEQRLGCRFCEDGIFAEMSLGLGDYQEKTTPIAGITYGFYSGPISALREAVGKVEPEWVQYFTEDSRVFCGFAGERLVSFCSLSEDGDCPLAVPGVRVGSIGCVGTLPEYRGRQIGLRMVDLATVLLQNEGFHKAYISYTHIDHWYAKLGYQTFARFRFE